MPRWKKKKSSLLCSYERTLFFSKCGRVKSFFKLFFHIRNPLSFFFLTGRQKNEEDEEEEEGRRRRRRGFFLHFFRCDAFVFLCVASTKRDFCLFWFKQQQSRTKQTNKKERMKKKRGEFFWDQHTTPTLFSNSEPPSYSYHPHLIIVQKEGQTTNFNSLGKRRREGDGVRVSA